MSDTTEFTGPTQSPEPTQPTAPEAATPPPPERIVVTGATGLIGRKLCAALAKKGYQITVFSRNPDKAVHVVPGALNYITWTPNEAQATWVSQLDGAYAVVHLAGAPIFGKRWDDAYKAELYHSRTDSTRTLVEAMAGLKNRPQVFVGGSGVGYYGARDATELDEQAAPGDSGWLTKICIDWEAEARNAETLGMRWVSLRTGIVLDAEEGALAQLKLPFQLYAGGPVLPGSQWFSWIHVADAVGIIVMALEDERVRGPVNMTAPNPQTNRDFSATLGKVLGVPSWVPVPGIALYILFGELAETLVTGQRAVPRKITDLGYQFRYSDSETALRNLLKR